MSLELLLGIIGAMAGFIVVVIISMIKKQNKFNDDIAAKVQTLEVNQTSIGFLETRFGKIENKIDMIYEHFMREKN